MCKPCNDSCCYDCSKELSFFHVALFFCGLPIFTISMFFNLAIWISLLIDPLITLGTFCNYALAASKNFLVCYQQFLVFYSKGTGLDGDIKSKKQCRGIFSCMMCCLPMLPTTIMTALTIPLGIFPDLLILALSKGKLCFQLTSTNIGTLKTTCTIYANMVRGYGQLIEKNNYLQKIEQGMKSMETQIERI